MSALSVENVESLNLENLEQRVAVPACVVTLVVCSNRTSNVRKHWKTNLESLENFDRFLIIMDTKETTEVRELRNDLDAWGIRVVVNDENLGLSYSRNLALKTCRTNYLVFIDDDVTISKETVRSIKQEFRAGSDIVGVRICRASEQLMPWYISEGQLHYLAIHNPKAKVFNTWGACMGLRLPFVRSFGLEFREELGRRGKGLQSGDDTTFLKEMKVRGAREGFLKHASVIHHIDEQRLSLSYMVRRAYWQGRSELRRGNVRKGLIKEWLRFFNTDSPGFRTITLALFYTITIWTGVVWEKIGAPRR